MADLDLKQSVKVALPKTARGYIVQVTEWEYIKNKVTQISNEPNIYLILASAFLGAFLSSLVYSLTGNFPSKVDGSIPTSCVISWAFVILSGIVTALCFFFGKKVTQVDKIQSSYILEQMNIIEARFKKEETKEHPSVIETVFYDIFDTEGRLSPEKFLEQGLGSKPFEVKGLLDQRIFNRAIEEAKKWGIKISMKPLSYFDAGYVTTIFKGYLEICLKQGQPIEENFAVLIHELAHLFLGHTGRSELSHISRKKPVPLLNRKLSRTAEELEAETVSFLICKKLDLETRSAEYIAAYIKDENDLLQFSYEIVIKIADKIEKLFLK